MYIQGWGRIIFLASTDIDFRILTFKFFVYIANWHTWLFLICKNVLELFSSFWRLILTAFVKNVKVKVPIKSTSKFLKYEFGFL